MITFITKKVHQVNEEPDVLQIKDEFTIEDLTFIKSLSNIGFDLETNDLDPFIGSILLMIIGNQEHQYVIDATTIDCETILLDIIAKEEWKSLLHNINSQQAIGLKYVPERVEEDYANNYRSFDKVILGANLKFDYKFVSVKYGIEFTKMFDVMIAEQRLFQGCGLSASLAAITERRLKIIRNKDVRSDFIGANPATFIFKNSHIQYGAEDISYLFDIVKIQKEDIAKNNQAFLIYGIEFPLIKELADSELEGFYINEEKWRENIVNNKESQFLTECKLDTELVRLKTTLLPKDEQIYLSNGKYGRVRQKVIPQQSSDNLFGDMFAEIEVNPVGKTKSKTKLKSPYVNYGSTTELSTIFARLKQPAPTISPNGQPGPYIIPTFITRRGKQIIDKSSARFTTGAKTIETYLIENPTLLIRNFIENLIKYREYSTKLNTFGEEFLIKYKNKVTKRFHTIYRQCQAITGRLQSGDTKNGWFNSQNIPAKKEYRQCFHANGDYVITSDLSGAEAVIMIDKAHDEKFYELAIVNDDAHSPLCQAVWRAIGEYRINTSYSEQQYNEGLRLANIVVSKKENKDMRTAYKPMTFGDIYGMGINKRAKTLGVNEEESKIAGKTQRSMIPKTYAMVERNEKFALANGYIVLNTRTNSKIWYPPVQIARQNNSQIPSNVEHEVKNSARNATIQGTQADMVKEMIVEIAKEAKRQDFKNRFSFALLGQVHDEIIYKSKDVTTLVEFKSDLENAEIEYVTIPQFINKMMCKIGNRYLSFIKITAETVVEKTWTK